MIAPKIFCVLSAPAIWWDFASTLLPAGGVDVRRGGMVYRIVTTDAPLNQQFLDPIDGELMSEMISFASLEDAKQWISNDVMLRQAATGVAS